MVSDSSKPDDQIATLIVQNLDFIRPVFENSCPVFVDYCTLQYLMGHSDISVTLNVYTHLGLQDAVEEMTRLQDLERAREEQERMDINPATDEGEAGMMVI